MTIAFLVLLAVILGCGLDAYSTDHLIDRGGFEKVSEWVIGDRPESWLVWAWVFVFPVVVCGIILYNLPEVWPVAGLLALWRCALAWRNHGLCR